MHYKKCSAIGFVLRFESLEIFPPFSGIVKIFIGLRCLKIFSWIILELFHGFEGDSFRIFQFWSSSSSFQRTSDTFSLEEVVIILTICFHSVPQNGYSIINSLLFSFFRKKSLFSLTDLSSGCVNSNIFSSFSPCASIEKITTTFYVLNINSCLPMGQVLQEIQRRILSERMRSLVSAIVLCLAKRSFFTLAQRLIFI